MYIDLILAILYYVVIIVTMLHVVMDNRQPAKTMAWALVIWFVPLAGIVLYLFFGVNTRRTRYISQRQLDELSKRSMLGFVRQEGLTIPEAHQPTVDLFINESLSLPFMDATLDIYTDGYQFVPALLAAVGKARDHIHMDMYIFEADALGNLVADALIAKAREGVEVRVIYDDVGCWRVPHRFFERMREGGVEVVPFLPVRFPTFTSKVNYRNHRKLIVVDGKTGFVGGMNIALRYVKGRTDRRGHSGNRGYWRDTMVKVSGTAVYGLQRAFLIDWYFVDRSLLSDPRYYQADNAAAGAVGGGTNLLQMVTSSPVEAYPQIMQGYVRIILAARRYVYLETPYFLPTDPVLFALKTAASSGVDVRLLVPCENDSWLVDWASRSYLREAVEAGIRVSLYTKGFMHSKLLVADDDICTCGSTNVDFRSFENNFESNVFVYGKDAAQRMRDIYLNDEAETVLLKDLPERMNPGFLVRFKESLVRLLAPLM
jgi:cardiolipin synthase